MWLFILPQKPEQISFVQSWCPLSKTERKKNPWTTQKPKSNHTFESQKFECNVNHQLFRLSCFTFFQWWRHNFHPNHRPVTSLVLKSSSTWAFEKRSENSGGLDIFQEKKGSESGNFMICYESLLYEYVHVCSVKGGLLFCLERLESSFARSCSLFFIDVPLVLLNFPPFHFFSIFSLQFLMVFVRFPYLSIVHWFSVFSLFSIPFHFFPLLLLFSIGLPSLPLVLHWFSLLFVPFMAFCWFSIGFPSCFLAYMLLGACQGYLGQ